MGTGIITKAGTFTVEGEVTVVNTYTVTLRNGRLVHDANTHALFDAGYVVLSRDDEPARKNR